MFGCLEAIVGATCILTGAISVDADTIRLDGQRYRIWAISAPERGHPDYEPGKAAMGALIDGQALTCERMQLAPSFDRPVVRCVMPDGTDIGEAMIRLGHAEESCRFSRGAYGECD
jgi:endonuclease YncB( thermonuclease family)